MGQSFYQQEMIRLQSTLLPHEDIYARIKKARNFMEKMYLHRIQLEQVAAAAHLSKFHFIRTFKNIYGCTPHQFLTELKIEKAKILLAKNQPVSQICYALGFSSLASFTNLFRQKTGCLPSAFIKQQAQGPDQYAGIFLKYPFSSFPAGDKGYINIADK